MVVFNRLIGDLKVNRAELADFIADQMETSKAQADKFITSFADAIYRNIKKDGVKIAGFGSFSAAKRKARVGRNPQTGEEIKIPSRWVPVFKAGTVFKDHAEKKAKK